MINLYHVLFVNVHPLQVYKKKKEKMPKEIKQQLPIAMEVPSEFMSNYLKLPPQEFDCNFSVIHDILVSRCEESAARGDSDREQHDRQIDQIKSNYDELISQHPQSRLNKADFLRPAFLQYLICAYCYEVW